MTTTSLIKYVSTAVDAASKSLAPELRVQCDKLYTRVERLARVAATISDDYSVCACRVLAQAQAVKDAVNMCLLIAGLAPTDDARTALCEYVASEAINDARRKAARENKIQR